MDQQLKVCRIGGGISSVFVPTQRFKSSLMTLTFAVPLTRETVSDNAILPYLLHRTCQKYPSMSELNARLAELYGAAAYAESDKLGDVQVLRIGVTALDDRFALEGEKISRECAELLCEMVFHPALDGETFREEDVQREKRLLLETLDSEYNEKRIYARKRLEQIMCEDEPYGIDRLGNKESIERITPRSAYQAWQRMLKTARVQINIIGNIPENDALEIFQNAFDQVDREEIETVTTKIAEEVGAVKRVEEKMAVAQSKLVIGFRTLVENLKEMAPVLTVAIDLYGGGPYSRLFMNVREKLSLCYYCSARFIRQKGIMILQSGVEEQNIHAAEEEISHQLQVMKKGQFTDQELNASKLALTDAVGTMEDSLSSIDSWYYRQMLLPDVQSPQEYAQRLQAVTREQVMEASESIQLDTIYVLKGNGQEETV